MSRGADETSWVLKEAEHKRQVRLATIFPPDAAIGRQWAERL